MLTVIINPLITAGIWIIHSGAIKLQWQFFLSSTFNGLKEQTSCNTKEVPTKLSLDEKIFSSKSTIF